jgi:uncharacterized protein YndB with AHSA1/START domain
MTTATNGSKLQVTLPSDREIRLTREFQAPRELVFQAFSKPEHVAQWWGQAGSTLAQCEMDFRPGGSWRFVERDAAGNEWGFRGEIREIVPPERIVQTFEFDGMPGHISIETMVLEDLGGRTRLTVTSAFTTVEDRDGMLQSGMESGASESYDRLEAYLRTMPNGTADREIVISRVLEAPRTLVFKAWTDPRHVAEWFGPNGFTLTVEEMDARPGGEFRYLMHGPDGVDYPSLIVFHEVVEPERLVYTHSSGEPDDPGFEVTVSFAAAAPNRTMLTLRQLHPTPEAREYVVKEYHAIEMGNQTLNRFAQFVGSLTSG